jgi:hypothetical protein
MAEVLLGSQMAVHSVQVRWDQVAEDLKAVLRAFEAVTFGPAEAELGARGINERQWVVAHGKVSKFGGRGR